MRKTIALLLCLALLASLAAGCTAAPSVSPEAAETPAPTEAPPATEEPAATPEPTPLETPEPTPLETPEPTPLETPEPEDGLYHFRPKVCSSYMTELFGEGRTETWFCLVDAVLAGEDTFACPDADTYYWVMGQYPDKCLPVLKDLIDYCVDRDHPVKDGVASFVYLVPPEEAAARIEGFGVLVEGILNEALEADYSDFEKALALYIYFSHHYKYDYEAYHDENNQEYLSSYRVLSLGKGICQEFSTAYSYLLLQAGVDADTMSGTRSYDGAAHQWSYVRLQGKSYHIDPTYGIGRPDVLAYFLMDDDQREAEDRYDRADFVLCSNYAQDHPHPDCPADDDSFREIWRGSFLELDHENRVLIYSVPNDDGEPTPARFYYSLW